MRVAAHEYISRAEVTAQQRGVTGGEGENAWWEWRIAGERGDQHFRGPSIDDAGSVVFNLSVASGAQLCRLRGELAEGSAEFGAGASARARTAPLIPLGRDGARHGDDGDARVGEEGAVGRDERPSELAQLVRGVLSAHGALDHEGERARSAGSERARHLVGADGAEVGDVDDGDGASGGVLDGGGDALRHHACGVVAAFHRVLALAGVHEDEVRRSVSRGDDVIRLDRNLRDGGEDRVVPAVTTEMVREGGHLATRPQPPSRGQGAEGERQEAKHRARHREGSHRHRQRRGKRRGGADSRGGSGAGSLARGRREDLEPTRRPFHRVTRGGALRPPHVAR